MQIPFYSIFYRFAHINTYGSNFHFVFFCIGNVKSYDESEILYYLKIYVSVWQRLKITGSETKDIIILSSSRGQNLFPNLLCLFPKPQYSEENLKKSR